MHIFSACFRLFSEFYSFLYNDKFKLKSLKVCFRLLSEFYSFLLYNDEIDYTKGDKFPSPFGVLFFFICTFTSFLLENKYLTVSVSFRSSILFYPPSIKPLFYDMLLGYFRENYLNFQFSFLKEQKLCSNSHFYSIVAISI